MTVIYFGAIQFWEIEVMESCVRRLKIPAYNPHSHNFKDSLWGEKSLLKKKNETICGCIADTAYRTLGVKQNKC